LRRRACAARNQGTCDNRLNIGIDVLEATILDGIRYRLMTADLFKEFCQEFHREVNRPRSLESATADSKKSELAQVERRIRRLVDLITEDDAPVKALKSELKSLECRQTVLQESSGATAAPGPLIHPNLSEVYRQRVATLQDALLDPSSRDEAFDLIRSLIDEVLLVPAAGVLRIEIKGELAGILELCDARANQKAGGLSTAGLAQQIKMVAGEGNHRQLTLPPVAV